MAALKNRAVVRLIWQDDKGRLATNDRGEATDHLRGRWRSKVEPEFSTDKQAFARFTGTPLLPANDANRRECLGLRVSSSSVGSTNVVVDHWHPAEYIHRKSIERNMGPCKRRVCRMQNPTRTSPCSQ